MSYTTGDFQSFVFYHSLTDLFKVSTRIDPRSGEEILNFKHDGMNVRPLNSNAIVVNSEGEADRLRNIKFGRQIIRWLEDDKKGFNFDLALKLEQKYLVNLDPENTSELLSVVRRETLASFQTAKNALRSRATRQALIAGQLVEALKVDLLSKLHVQMFSADLESRSEILAQAFKKFTNPEDMRRFFRQLVIEKLRQQYKEYKLPDSVIGNLEIQEAVLADHRRIEILVLLRGRLAMFSRVYIGNRTIPYEHEAFEGGEPSVSLIQFGMLNGKVPNYLLPAERVIKPNEFGKTIIDRYRDDPRYRNHLFVELGRTWLDSKLDQQTRDQVKSLFFSQLYNVYLGIAPAGDISRILQFANAGPAGSRHYKQTYGFSEIPDGVLKETQFEPQFRFDLRIRAGDEFRGMQDEGQESRSSVPIHLLIANARDFFGAIASQIRPIVGEAGDIQMDPRFSFSGGFHLGNSTVRTEGSE
jgi:hypothetical protein